MKSRSLLVLLVFAASACSGGGSPTASSLPSATNAPGTTPGASVDISNVTVRETPIPSNVVSSPIAEGPDGSPWFGGAVNGGAQIAMWTYRNGAFAHYAVPTAGNPADTNPEFLSGYPEDLVGETTGVFGAGQLSNNSDQQTYDALYQTTTSGTTTADFSFHTDPGFPTVKKIDYDAATGWTWWLSYDANALAVQLEGGPAPQMTVNTSATVGNGNFAMAVGSEGVYYFASSRFVEVSKTNGSTIATYSAGGIQDVRDMTAGSDGNIWFTDATNNAIGKLSPTGTITEYPLPSTAANPGRIVSGGDGALWFTESTKIGRITTDGKISEYAVQSGYTPVGIVGPLHLASCNQNAIWFLEQRSAAPNNSYQLGEVTFTR